MTVSNPSLPHTAGIVSGDARPLAKGRGNKTNLALSGWSGAGTSTITLILAILLQRKYYYLGSVFREVVRQLSKTSADTVDSQLPKYEKYIQPTLGKLIDQYVDHKLIHAQGIILETDISAFRVGKRPEYFSIFLKTDFDVRASRFNWDQRSGNNETLQKRDSALQEEYLKLWNIDTFDENLIREKFNFVLDNSNLKIEETVTKILLALQQDSRFNLEFQGDSITSPRDISTSSSKVYVASLQNDGKEKTSTLSENLKTQIHKLSKNLGKTGKTKLQQTLRNQNLMISPQEIMKEILEIFPQAVEELPKEARKIFEQM